MKDVGGMTSECKHCWHRSSFQHAVPNHRDDICCHCGESKCVHLEQYHPEGHGKYLPGTYVREPKKESNNEQRAV